MTACFLTGPVAMKDQVRAAFCAPTVPHRDPAFLASIGEVRGSLASLVNAAHAVLLVGSGTLANDAVAAQIRDFDGEGLVLANGEFGERLIDHARRWDLRFDALRRPWGQAFDWNHARRVAERLRPSWIWAVLTETSTGVLNPLAELRALSTQTGAHLCLDAVSAIGLVPVDLAGVRLATAVSGKGLAAYPGLAAVFHDGRLEHARRTPRYLDLAEYERMDGVPFTHSSNLVSALHCALRAHRLAGEVRTRRAALRFAANGVASSRPRPARRGRACGAGHPHDSAAGHGHRVRGRRPPLRRGNRPGLPERLST